MAIPVNKNADRIFRHSITAVDTCTYQGQDYLVAEDSADKGTKFGHRKLISRDFFKKKCYLARYPLNFKFDEMAKPKFDGSIVSAQRCLQYEKFFPTNIPLFENIGPTTKAALIKFQAKYNLPQTGGLNTETVDKMRALYS